MLQANLKIIVTNKQAILDNIAKNAKKVKKTKSGVTMVNFLSKKMFETKNLVVWNIFLYSLRF